MNAISRSAAAAAALAAALLAGCGPPEPPGGVELTVTRDFGTAPVLDRPDPARSPSDTVAALLQRDARVPAASTRASAPTAARSPPSTPAAAPSARYAPAPA